MLYPLTVTVSHGATGPVYGMAGVRLTAIEAQEVAQARLNALQQKWRDAGTRSYLLTYTQDEKPRSVLKFSYLRKACDELRSRGVSVPRNFENTIDTYLKLGSRLTAEMVNVERVAFDLYCIDFAEAGFGKAKRWATDFLKTVQDAASSPDLVNFAADALWQRAGLVSFDVPLLGTYTLADVADNLSSVDTVIAKINAIDWTAVGKSVIATVAPAGGIADTGLQTLGAAMGLMTDIASAASAIGIIELSTAITGIIEVVTAAMPIIIAVLVVVAIGEAIWYSVSGADDAEAAREAARQADATIAVIQDLLGASASVQTDIAGTVRLRCYEMAAYGSPIRRKLWAGAKSGAHWDLNAVEVTKSASGCWSDGYQGTRDGGRTIFGDNTASDKRKRKRFARYGRDFIAGLQSYLAGFETVEDRRLAFEYLGTVLIPPRRLTGQPPIWRFYSGLWAPTRPKAGSKFKVSTLPPALAQLARAEAIHKSLPARTVRIGGYLDATGKKLNPPSSPILPLVAVGALIYLGSKG